MTSTEKSGPVEMDENELPLLGRRIAEVLERQWAAPLSAGLYLVATPIGNLADISLRALAILARADRVYCEDKRHSARLLNHYGLRVSLGSYHEHSTREERQRLLAQVQEGKIVAVISDAGTPLVSDPGYKLVVEAREKDLPVIAIPGPSAVLTALVASGLATDRFLFAGFLPNKQGLRQKRLRELAATRATLVFFDSPKRVAASLQDMSDILGPRPAVLARELTKLHETSIKAPLPELAVQIGTAGRVRGEVVLLVAGAPDKALLVSDEQLLEALALEMQKASARDAVRTVCARFDLPRSKVYDLAIQLKDKHERD